MSNILRSLANRRGNNNKVSGGDHAARDSSSSVGNGVPADGGATRGGGPVRDTAPAPADELTEELNRRLEELSLNSPASDNAEHASLQRNDRRSSGDWRAQQNPRLQKLIAASKPDWLYQELTETHEGEAPFVDQKQVQKAADRILQFLHGPFANFVHVGGYGELCENQFTKHTTILCEYHFKNIAHFQVDELSSENGHSSNGEKKLHLGSIDDEHFSVAQGGNRLIQIRFFLVQSFTP